MQARRFLLLTLVLAGCVSAPSGDVASVLDPEALAARIGTPIEQLHDHTDPALHTGSSGLRFVAWEPLIPQELGEEGFAGMRIVECAAPVDAAPSSRRCGDETRDIAYIATDGAHAGFLMVDVSDPTRPRLLSQYVTPGGASQEAVPTADGNWVFLNLQRRPAPEDILADPTRGTGTGIQIIDVSDKTNPRFESFFPVEVQGTHVMMSFEWQGRSYLAYNGQPVRQGLPTGDVYTPPPGNEIKIAEFLDVSGTRVLRPVGTFRLPAASLVTTSQGCFPHDQWVEAHPVSGRLIMYVGHWDCGVVTVDISDPANPVFLDMDDEMPPSTRNRVHFVRPDPTERQGRTIAWSGPEIDLSPGEPGYLRAYDVTDPTDIAQIGWWRLPGDVENDKPFIFSPHNFDFRGDLMALAHYHAGVWVLNVSDPTSPHAVAFYLPHGDDQNGYDGPDVWRKTPNFPEAYFPNAYEVKWHTSQVDGETYLLVTERGSGLYVLKLDPTAG